MNPTCTRCGGAESLKPGWIVTASVEYPCPVCNTTEGRSEDRRASGVELIAAERERQVSAEGWTLEHDDQHMHGELVEAAECYTYAARTGVLHPPRDWPWEPSWWKPSDDPIRNLVKAGALIAAEIDRLQRKANP